jgi:hypothetical protein
MSTNDNNGVRGTADLSKIRSKSYDVPRKRPDTDRGTASRPVSRAHFAPDTMPNHISRPNYNDRVNSTGNIRPTPRPKLGSRVSSFAPSAAKRRSIARTISSFSVYSNFAGERLDDGPYHHSKSNLGPVASEEKRKSYQSSLRKHEESTIGDEMIEEAEDNIPKSSVGKAMFMFLKAFIGSGVLFLPKAYVFFFLKLIGAIETNTINLIGSKMAV